MEPLWSPVVATGGSVRGLCTSAARRRFLVQATGLTAIVPRVWSLYGASGPPPRGRSGLARMQDLTPAPLGDRRPQCPGGLKLYVPSQYQRFVAGLYVTMTLASKPRNCPVPPENLTTPERVANERVTWPNALFPGPV